MCLASASSLAHLSGCLASGDAAKILSSWAQTGQAGLGTPLCPITALLGSFCSCCLWVNRPSLNPPPASGPIPAVETAPHQVKANPKGKIPCHSPGDSPPSWGALSFPSLEAC